MAHIQVTCLAKDLCQTPRHATPCLQSPSTGAHSHTQPRIVQQTPGTGTGTHAHMIPNCVEHGQCPTTALARHHINAMSCIVWGLFRECITACLVGPTTYNFAKRHHRHRLPPLHARARAQHTHTHTTIAGQSDCREPYAGLCSAIAAALPEKCTTHSFWIVLHAVQPVCVCFPCNPFLNACRQDRRGKHTSADVSRK